MMSVNNFQTVEYGQEIGGIRVYPEFIRPEIALYLGGLAKDFFEAHPEIPYANNLSALIGSICINSENPDTLGQIPINKEFAENPLVESLDTIIPVIDATTVPTSTTMVNRYKKGATMRYHTDSPHTVRAISLHGQGKLMIPGQKPIELNPGDMFHPSEGALHAVANTSDAERFSMCLYDATKKVSQ
jgi:quercetin dioxygenase-like cupin family protein